MEVWKINEIYWKKIIRVIHITLFFFTIVSEQAAENQCSI